MRSLLSRHPTSLGLAVLSSILLATFAASWLVLAGDAPATECAPKECRFNPDEGLSDAERFAKHEAARSDFFRRLDEWYDALDISGLDLRALPRGEKEASYVESASTLQEAVAGSELAVFGTVATIEPEKFWAWSVIEIASTYFGESRVRLLMKQNSGFGPDQDWEIIIVDSRPSPLLLPGDQVILLLKDNGDGSYSPLPWAGTYAVSDGRITALPGNPVKAEVDGRTVDDFANELRRLKD